MGDFNISSPGGAGSSSNTGTSGNVAPAPLVQDTIPAGFNPTEYEQDNDGNWHASAGIDTQTVAVPFFNDPVGSGPKAPYGTYTRLRRMYIRDNASATQAGKNALVSINHESGQQTSNLNQDRALWVQHYTPVNDTSDRYGVATLQMELGIRGTPNWVGSPDGEASCASFQLTDQHIGDVPSPNKFGVNGVRISATRNVGTGCWGSNGFHGQLIQIANKSTAAGTGMQMVGLQVFGEDTTSGGSTNISYWGIQLKKGVGTFPLSQRALQIEDHGSRTVDYNIFSNSDGPNSGRNRFQGRVEANRDVRTGSAANTDFAGQLTLTGGTATYTFTETYASPPIVTVGNTTSTNGVRVQVTNTGFTLTGTTGEVINYICIGRN